MPAVTGSVIPLKHFRQMTESSKGWGSLWQISSYSLDIAVSPARPGRAPQVTPIFGLDPLAIMKMGGGLMTAASPSLDVVSLRSLSPQKDICKLCSGSIWLNQAQGSFPCTPHPTLDSSPIPPPGMLQLCVFSPSFLFSPVWWSLISTADFPSQDLSNPQFGFEALPR